MKYFIVVSMSIILLVSGCSLTPVANPSNLSVNKTDPTFEIKRVKFGHGVYKARIRTDR